MRWHDKQPIPGQKHSVRGFQQAKPKLAKAGMPPPRAKPKPHIGGILGDILGDFWDQQVVRRHIDGEFVMRNRMADQLRRVRLENEPGQIFYDPLPAPPPPVPLKHLREMRAAVANANPERLDHILGLEQLGSGVYASVYALSKRRVLKICRCSDPSYERFVAKCIGSTNPHLPRIHWHGRWGPYFVAILERLNRIPYDSKAYHDLRTAIRLKDNPYVSVTCPVVAECRRILGNHIGDLHDGNIMLRGETPVITDPMERGGS